MKKVAAFLLAVVVMVCPSLAASKRPAILDSVKPVQFAVYDVNKDIYEVGNHCTAGKINDQEGYWLTAAHCTGHSEQYFIAGHQAWVLDVDKGDDMAIMLSQDAPGEALRLAGRGADWGDKVATAGYSFGLPEAFYFEGKVAHTNYVFPDDPQHYTMFDMVVAGGQSGSPIVNKHNEVVSVVQVGWSGFSPVTGGVTFEKLVRFAGKYWGKK